MYMQAHNLTMKIPKTLIKSSDTRKMLLKRNKENNIKITFRCLHSDIKNIIECINQQKKKD